MAQQPTDTSHMEAKTDSTKTDVKIDSDHYILDVQLNQAKDLKDADAGLIDKSDSYCICTVDGVSYQTKTLGNNLNPVWNEKCSFFHRTMPTEIRFELWDSDETTKDEGLGKVVFPLKGFFDSNHAGFDGWLDITTKGKLNVCIRGTHIKPQAVQEELNNLHLSNTKLKKELDDVREQHNKDAQQIVVLTENLNKSEKQNTEWHGRMNDLEKQNTDLNGKINTLEKQNNELKDKISVAEKQNRELFEKYKNLEGLNAELSHQERVKLESLTSELEALKKEKQTVTQNLENELTDQRSRYELLSKEKMDLVTQVSQQRGDIEKLSAVVEQKDNTMSQLRAELEQQCNAIASLQAEVNAQRANREKLMTEMESLRNDLQKSADQVSTLQKDNSTVSLTTQELTESLKELQAQDNRSQQVIKELSANVSVLEKQLAESKEENANLRSSNENKTMQLAAMKEQFAEVIEKTNAEKQVYTMTIAELTSQLQMQMANCAELERTLVSLDAANNHNNNNNNNTNNANHNNKAEIAALQERMQTLAVTNERLTSEKKQYEMEVNALRQEVQRRIISTQTGGVTTMPLQHRNDTRLVALGGIAVVSTAVFVLLWRMNTRGVAMGAGAVLK